MNLLIGKVWYHCCIYLSLENVLKKIFRSQKKLYIFISLFPLMNFDGGYYKHFGISAYMLNLELIFSFRLLTRRNVDTRRCEKIMETAVDRLRIPWWGGAKKVPPDVACGLVLVPFFILLGCISWTFIFITYLIILPTVMFSIHRFLRRKVVHKDTSTYQSGDSKDIKKYPRAKFYLTWLASSIVALLLIYYTQVIAYLKISPYENLAFMVFVWLSGTCLYLVRATACAGFDPPEKRGDDVYDDVIESGAWRICGECEQQVPRLASHCRTCGICYFMRDHHCVW